MSGGRRHGKPKSVRALLRLEKRENEGEASAVFGFAIDANGAAVFFHNTAGDRQAEPGATSLCREERLKDVGDIFRGDALASIGNRDLYIRAVRLKSEFLPERIG